MAGSCSAQSMPLKERLRLLNDQDDSQLPSQYYWMTIGMVGLVVGVPLVYRWLWLLLWDIVSGVREDLATPKPPKGCRRYGVTATRNLSAEDFAPFQKKHARHNTFPQPSEDDYEQSKTAQHQDVQLEGRIESLHLHPIKSCPPIAVDSATLTSSGLAFDRIFSFAQLNSGLPSLEGKVEHTWKIITQRESAQMALMETQLWIPDPSSQDYDKDDVWIKNGGCLVVRFPFVPDFEMTRQGVRDLISQFLLRRRGVTKAAGKMLEVRLPLYPCQERIKEKQYQTFKLHIWKEFPETWDVGCEVDSEILRKLGYSLGISNPFTIFRAQDDNLRLLYKNAPTKEQLGYQTKVGLQDAYPISIQSINSIKAAEKSATDMATQKGRKYRPDSRRFRGNIYISGTTPFVENDMLRAAIQGKSTSSTAPKPVVMSLPCRIPRCQMPNNDPLVGRKDREVFQPLVFLNQKLKIDPNAKTGCLGMAAVPLLDAIGQQIHVGDELVLYKRGEHLYNKWPEKEQRTPTF